MKLQTRRLILKTPTQNDLVELSQVLAEPTLLRASGLMLPIEQQQRILAIQLLAKHNHVLVIKMAQTVIGMIMLSRCYTKTGVLIPSQYELGYLLSPVYWQRGLMTEALRTVLTVIPSEVKVVARCNNGNLRSQRVLEKCGFSTSGDGNWWYKG